MAGNDHLQRSRHISPSQQQQYRREKEAKKIAISCGFSLIPSPASRIWAFLLASKYDSTVRATDCKNVFCISLSFLVEFYMGPVLRSCEPFRFFTFCSFRADTKKLRHCFFYLNRAAWSGSPSWNVDRWTRVTAFQRNSLGFLTLYWNLARLIIVLLAPSLSQLIQNNVMNCFV